MLILNQGYVNRLNITLSKCIYIFNYPPRLKLYVIKLTYGINTMILCDYILKELIIISAQEYIIFVFDSFIINV